MSNDASDGNLESASAGRGLSRLRRGCGLSSLQRYVSTGTLRTLSCIRGAYVSG